MLLWSRQLELVATQVTDGPREMDLSTRAAVLLGLLAIVILGIGGMMMIWLIGRFVRRRMNLDAPRGDQMPASVTSSLRANQNRSTRERE